MPFIVSGWNSFYEGWLANCFEIQFDETKDVAWKEGWKTGNETGENKMIALRDEIILGNSGGEVPKPHVKVTCMETDEKMIASTEDGCADNLTGEMDK